MAVTSSSSVIVAAGSAVLLAVGLGYLSRTNTKGHDITDTDDELEEVVDLDNMITPEEICEIFDRLFYELQSAFASLMQQVQMMQNAGQMLPEKYLRTVIKTELERAITAKQKQIIDDMFHMDLVCCEKATWEFIDVDKNEDVIKAVERFQKLWDTATGEETTGYSPMQPGGSNANVTILSIEETIRAATIYFNSITDCMRELVQEYKSAGKDLSNSVVANELNQEFAAKAGDYSEAALNDVNISTKEFEASVKANGDNMFLVQALGELQRKQQTEMMAMGSAN